MLDLFRGVKASWEKEAQGGEGQTERRRARGEDEGTMEDDERERSDASLSFMNFSEVCYAAAAAAATAATGALEGHWITAAPRPLDVITARLAPGCRSYNKEGHREEKNLSEYKYVSWLLLCINA